MAIIQLFRIDFRLIHGQVMTKWIKQVPTDRILIIDEELSKDDFMADIYRCAAPPNILVEILGQEASVAAWKENQFGEGNLMILVRNVKTALYLKENGVGIDQIQIGGLGGSPGRIMVIPAVTLDSADADALEQIQDLGCRVYAHVVPSEPKVELKKLIEKYRMMKNK